VSDYSQTLMIFTFMINQHESPSSTPPQPEQPNRKVLTLLREYFTNLISPLLKARDSYISPILRAKILDRVAAERRFAYDIIEAAKANASDDAIAQVIADYAKYRLAQKSRKPELIDIADETIESAFNDIGIYLLDVLKEEMLKTQDPAEKEDLAQAIQRIEAWQKHLSETQGKLLAQVISRLNP
jgi:hypothetical protein